MVAGREVIAVVSDVVLVREAVVDYLRRSRSAKVVSTSTESLASALSALAPERIAVAVVDLHQLDSADPTIAASDVIRKVRASCPGATIVAIGSQIELAAQAMDADILLHTNRASIHDLSTISSALQPERRQQAGALPEGLRPDRERWNSLSGREREVLGLLTRGHDNLKIAAELGISERTVKAHVAGLLKKLGAKNRTQLALLGRDAGFHHP